MASATIFANVWQRMPFVAITLLADLPTNSPSFHKASDTDGVTPEQRFRHVTLPQLTPIIAVVMTFSVLFILTDFPLIDVPPSVFKPTLVHVHKPSLETSYPEWRWNRVRFSVVATGFSLYALVLAAYAIERLRRRGAKQVDHRRRARSTKRAC